MAQRNLNLGNTNQTGLLFEVNGQKLYSPSGVKYDAIPINQLNEQQLQQIANQNPELADSIMDSLGFAGSPTGGVDLSGLPPEWQVMYQQLEDYLAKLEANGKKINPNIEITPEQIASFTKQAEGEIDPYFASQLKIAREDLLRTQGFSVDQVNQFEQNLERQFGKQTRELGESAAERGFAQSGIRQREERELAFDTQRQLDLNRQQAQFTGGTQARTFAQKYGGVQGQQLPGIPQIGAAPRVLAGEGTFQRDTSRNLPFYELSPDVYSGLIGEQEFQRRGSISTRASGLESAERTRQALEQQRNLTF